MSRKSPSRNPAIAVLLCIGAVAACGEPQCPRGFFKKGDTCYRIRDGGAQSTDAVEGEDASIAEDDEAGSLDDVFIDAGPEAGSRDEPDAPGVDAGMPAVDAAPAIDAAPAVDAALPVDGGGESDSAALDAGKVTCASQPCQNGGTCTADPSGVRCSCPEPFIGDACEAKICPTVILRNPDDLAKTQSCGEIHGDLTVTSAGITSIAEKDLPFLKKITGNFSLSGLANNGIETPRLRELKLTKLREIGGNLSVTQTGAGSVIEIHFPELARVGGSVFFGDAETRRLELPALRTVDGGFALTALKRLCELEIDAIERISTQLTVAAIFNLPASRLEPLRRASRATATESGVGCCIPIDRMCPGGLTAEEAASCGCSSP